MVFRTPLPLHKKPLVLQTLISLLTQFDRYVKLTSPHIPPSAPPETWINDTLQRLRSYDLTKPEAMTIINLGIGLDRSELPKVNGTISSGAENVQQPGDDQAMSTEDEDQTQAPNSPTLVATDAADVETSEAYHQYLLSRVVENMEERFPGEEGEEKIQQILGVLKECIPIEGRVNR